ncbi:hypothetical protein [Tenacibaculum finnmarkense]|nr:hypothetical protein [Tenacibaculum finnmarkense]MBE7689042.1 hypothetical protein [Tenacibaculum finnmarkense genomovar ulcerans]MCG8831459.1 hypothetical protein [Tenacibaculum finnmarkense]
MSREKEEGKFIYVTENGIKRKEYINKKVLADDLGEIIVSIFKSIFK